MEGTTENSHTGHRVHTSESTDVKVQNRFNMGSNIACIAINCNYRTAATLYTLETWFVSGTVHNLNPLNAELNPIRHLLALVGVRHIVHVSRIRVNYPE